MAKTRLEQFRLDHPVFVTRPRLPGLGDYVNLLEGVWDRQWLTNCGVLHEELEARLGEWLGVPELRLVSSGMAGLLVALLALDARAPGEVVTTPFTFPATVHAIRLAGHEPVFCDLQPDGYNIDPVAIERSLTSRTVAILAVHAFGTRCDVDALAAIGNRAGVPVLYDAAHAFGATYRGRALVAYGDMSVLSFHATKLFTTAEGGAIATGSEAVARRIEELRDFGIRDEATVVGPGLNGKMSELHAALGLAHLPGVRKEIGRRRIVAHAYQERLAGVPGVSTLGLAGDDDWNCAYFPVRINAESFGMDADRVKAELRGMNVFARRYFAPLCSRIEPYASLPSAAPAKLPEATRIAAEVLCLPIYGELAEQEVEAITGAFRHLATVG